MIQHSDDRRGMVKVYWENIRDRIIKIEPTFTKIVDELNPGKSYPLFLAYYPYGTIKGDTQSTLFPNKDGSFYRITDPTAPTDIIKHLGYSKNNAPLAMLLDKNMELFVDMPKENITIPRMLYTPGSLFPFSRILSRKSERTYAPNGVLTMTSGARSVFMLPNIGCATNHSNLQKDFNVQNPAAKSLYEHWTIFKEIAEAIKCDWNSSLVYFSQIWLDMIHTDRAWMKLKLYLHELAWEHYEFQRSHFYYDLSLSIIQKKRNLKPNPYLVDTAKHLITTAIGAAPGYIPAFNDDALPRQMIQHVFTDSYGLKKYLPTILQPSHYQFENAQYPIYYSLQHPSTHAFSPKSTNTASTLSEMRELERITRIFIEELSRKDSTCADTIIGSISKHVEFKYYHNKIDPHRIVKPSLEIFKNDERFHEEHLSSKSSFASDAPFLRGCISIQSKV